MIRAKSFILGLSLVLIVHGMLLPPLALADGESRAASRPRLVATPAPLLPIGEVESPGLFKVNGTLASGKGLIWRNDILQAPERIIARVSLGALGKVTLEPNTVVSFTTVEGPTAQNMPLRQLHVHLSVGSLELALLPETSAYLESSEGSFIISAGARLRFGLREHRAFVDVTGGGAMAVGVWPIHVPPLLLAKGKSAKITHPSLTGAPAPTLPIGEVESLGPFKVNGAPAFGKGMIWRNDQLQAPEKMTARVSLGELGKATLEPGAVVSFTTVGGVAGQKSTHRQLHVRLTAGSLALVLPPQTSAYLESAEGSFIASAGARLRFGLREHRAFADAASGSVVNLGVWTIEASPPVMMAAARLARLQAQVAQQTYRLRPVGGQNNSAVFDVRARASRQIQVQVTDDHDRPVPDIPIIFALGSNVGRFGSAAATTNQQGIASVNLTANNQVSSSTFTATVQGTNISMVGQIVVLKALPTFWTFQNAGPVLGTAVAAGAAAVTTVVTKDDPLPVKAVGRPVIKP
jgi:hypothetical protein